jgi:hypothetical protein
VEAIEDDEGLGQLRFHRCLKRQPHVLTAWGVVGPALIQTFVSLPDDAKLHGESDGNVVEHSIEARSDEKAAR